MRILIVIIILVTLFGFQPIQNNVQDQQVTDSIERVDIVSEIDLNSQIINTKEESLFKQNEINQNHSQESCQILNNKEQINLVQYQLDKQNDNQFSQKSSTQNNLIQTQQFLQEQPIQSDSSINKTGLNNKYIQIQQIELNQQTFNNILLNAIPQVQERNPLKLLLLYSNNSKYKNKDDNQQQIAISNELILDQLEREKKEKIMKMQNLIIEQLKDKKLELKKEESFFEQDFIEYSMKTLINNNNLRGK